MIEPTATLRISERGFLHKRIAKFAGGVFKTGLGVVSQIGPPGIRQAAGFGRSLLRGGSRDPRFLRSRASILSQGRLQSRRSFGTGITLPQGTGAPSGVSQAELERLAGQLPGIGRECPKGHHLNKSSYFLQDGSHVPEGTRCVKNRRRNNDNGRASLRAARRLLGRKKSQDTVDRALRAFSPPRRSRSTKAKPGGTQTIVTS